jgi:hypothetical protein
MVLCEVIAVVLVVMHYAYKVKSSQAAGSITTTSFEVRTAFVLLTEKPINYCLSMCVDDDHIFIVIWFPSVLMMITSSL